MAAWGALVAASAYLEQARHVYLPLCPLKRFTGVPCPTCGATRAVLATLGGHVMEGFLYNPLVFVVLAALAAGLLMRVFFARRVSVEMTRREQRWALVLAVILLAANWAYVLLRGM